jgi:hypothetical protein
MSRMRRVASFDVAHECHPANNIPKNTKRQTLNCPKTCHKRQTLNCPKTCHRGEAHLKRAVERNRTHRRTGRSASTGTRQPHQNKLSPTLYEHICTHVKVQDVPRPCKSIVFPDGSREKVIRRCAQHVPLDWCRLHCHGTPACRHNYASLHHSGYRFCPAGLGLPFTCSALLLRLGRILDIYTQLNLEDRSGFQGPGLGWAGFLTFMHNSNRGI